MRGLKFLGYLLLCLLLGMTLLSWYNYGSLQVLLTEIKDFGNFINFVVEKVSFYFSYAGSWNYLILMLLLAFLVVLYTCNDLWLEKYLHSRKQKSFLRFGYTWLLQRSMAFVLLAIECVLIANLFVWSYTRQGIISDFTSIKHPQTVLLLGTNKELRNGEGANLYFTYRIDAVRELYRQGKVKKIIISGDNGRVGYNEPADMQNALLKKGVPASIIELDYAGFRTLDSVVRLKGHFKVKDALIVSQRFHIERALLLAWLYDIEAVGYPAEGSMTVAMAARELLAKPKALLDVFVFNMQPRYGKTYAKATVNLNDSKDRAFIGVVLFCCLFAGLMVWLFFND
ncbi:SanA/YdcF family protein [Nafulsella turpanensis]|uniref:SanA/YdcF family protein n=1 Tax=Nafulsella turpanensis TaxID=1265690 RepID=UPI0003460F3B|nr:ElyC/SanA/YdcF family protein [Nafulsella turpanensis]